MFNLLLKRIAVVVISLQLGASASRAQGFGEGGSYAQKPSGTGIAEANVNLATGHIAPALPLLTLPGITGGVAMSLQYQAGAGVQVNVTSSEVGLGWALSGGGAIVRDVRGFPDDSEHGWIIDLGGNSYHNIYFQFGPNLHSLPVRTSGDVVKYFKASGGNFDQTPGGTDHYGAGTYENDNFLTWLYPASQVASYGQYSFSNTYTPYGQPNSSGNFQARYSGVFSPDNEPDIYTLALPTGSLQFVLDPSGNPVPLQAQSIKIQPLNLGTRYYNSGGLLREFLVTTSDGVKYYFGDATTTGFKEHVTVTTRVLEMANLGSKSDLAPYINKWHLRQIVYPSGETVDYAYSVNKNYEISTNNYLRQDWVFTAINGSKYNNCQQCLDYGHAWHARSWNRSYTVRSTVSSTDAKQLASITSAQGSLQFSYQSAIRKDVGGTTNALSSIQLLNTRGDIIKRLDLVQHYADYGQTVPNAMAYDRYHLLLDRIVDRGSGCDYINLWQFSYNQNTFCRNAATKDYWGYLNGLTYPSDGILVAPCASPVISGNSYSLSGRSRDPSASFTQFMILQSMTSVTGAAQSFTYQLNDDNVGIGSNTNIRAVGGLRILRISKYDGINHSNDIVDEFTYRKADDVTKSSGTWGDGGMYNKLQLIHDGTDDTNSRWPDNPTLSDSDIRGTVPYCYTTGSNNRRADYYYMLRSDASMYEYSSDYIDYSCVTVSHGTKGKTRYEFTSWADATHQDYTDSDTRQVGNNLNTCPNDPLSPSRRGAILTLPFSLEAEGLSLYSTYNGNPVYTPSISADFPRRSSRSAERGLPLRVTQLNNNNVAVAATINEYDFSNTLATIPTVNAVYVKPSFETFGFSQFFTYFQLYYYNISSQWCPLKNTTEIVYNQNSNGDITKSVATRTAIEYDATNLFPSKITKYTTTCSSPTTCQTNALGQYQVTEFRRAQSSSFADGSTDGTADQTSSAGLLRNAGMMAAVIEQEQYSTATLNGTKVHLSATLNTYKSINGHVVPFETYVSPPAASFTPATVTHPSSGWELARDGSYRLTSTVTDYTSGALPVNTIGRDAIPSATIWGYSHTLPIATVINGTAVTGAGNNDMKATAGHTSFEEDGTDSDNWTVPTSYSNESKTGSRSAHFMVNQTYGLEKRLILTKENQQGSLLFSCWAKVPNGVTTATTFKLAASSTAPQNIYQQSPDIQIFPGQDWRYCEFAIDVNAPAATQDLSLLAYLWMLNGNELLLDEMRIHRADAQMQTATYRPLVGKTSSTGPDGRTKYYTYASDNSPLLVLNHNHDVLSRTQSKAVNGGKLTADFVAPGYGTTQVPVGFASELNGCVDGTEFIWSFGDNSGTVTGPSPSHAYTSSGTYQVSLIVSHPQRGVDKVIKNIQVCDPLSLYIDTQGDTYVDYCNNPGANSFTLTAVVNNPCAQPISYQWQSLTDPMPGQTPIPWGNIPGEQGASFFSQVVCGQTVHYRCIITMADGSTNENDPSLPEVTTTGSNQSGPGTPVCGC